MADEIKSSISERNTKVIKGIERTLNTGKYESIRISVSFEEEIVWTTLDERQKKIDAISKHVINDFQKTKSEVCQSLGLEEKKAFGNNKEDTVVDNGIFDKL
jgi:hypothetical protein